MGVIEATRGDEVGTAEAAAMLGCSVRTVRRLHEDGILRASRLTPRGRSRLRFRREDVVRVLAAAVLADDGELAA